MTHTMLLHSEFERHPDQDDWGKFEVTVLLSHDLLALAGDHDTPEFDEALDALAEDIQEWTGYNLHAYSGGPGRAYKHAPSIRQDEWDGLPAITITSFFGKDV